MGAGPALASLPNGPSTAPVADVAGLFDLVNPFTAEDNAKVGKKLRDAPPGESRLGC